MKMDELISVFFNDYPAFQRECETGSPMQVILSLKEACVDRAMLEVDWEEWEEWKEWNGWEDEEDEEDWGDDEIDLSPVEGAIVGDNRGVFRFFLELGLMCDTKCGAVYGTFPKCVLKRKPPRIMKLLDRVMPGWKNTYSNVLPWWTHKYSRQENSSLQPKLEKQIILGELSEVLWIGLRGGRLLRPDILASKAFEKASPMMRKIVWHIIVPGNSRQKYQDWLLKNKSNGYKLLPNKPMATAKENLEKLDLSLGLLGSIETLFESMTDEDKLELLKYISDHHHGQYFYFARKLHPLLCNNILLEE